MALTGPTVASRTAEGTLQNPGAIHDIVLPKGTRMEASSEWTTL